MHKRKKWTRKEGTRIFQGSKHEKHACHLSRRNDALSRLGLDVSGGAVFGDNGQFISDGTTDFSHTASTNYYYIADADGNAIPGSENIRIMGDYGADVKNAVPEPGAAGWLGLGGCGWLGLRAGRRALRRRGDAAA